MPSSVVLISIGQYVIAFLCGMLFYYVTRSDQSHKSRKQAIDLTLSYIINFILYTWLAKIVILFPLFIKDPFAVLPYPSDSRMFYVANVFLLIHILVQIKREKLHIEKWKQAIIPIWLMSGFVYELIEVMYYQFQQSWSTLILYSILLLLYMFWERVNVMWLIGIWAFIQAAFAFYFSYTVVYGFMITTSYFIIVFIGVIIFSWMRKGR